MSAKGPLSYEDDIVQSALDHHLGRRGPASGHVGFDEGIARETGETRARKPHDAEEARTQSSPHRAAGYLRQAERQPARADKTTKRFNSRNKVSCCFVSFIMTALVVTTAPGGRDATFRISNVQVYSILLRSMNCVNG